MTGAVASEADVRSPVERHSLLTRIETAFVFLFLIMYSDGILPRLLASEDDPNSSGLLRALWVPSYVFILIALIPLWKKVLMIASKSPGLVLLGVIALASTTWSILPDVTMRRGIAIAFTTLFGIYLACRFSWRDLLRLLGYAWLVLAAGSFFASLLIPSFGVDNDIHVGAWRGFWWEKNAFGGHMARASFLFAFLMVVDTRWRTLWGGALVLTSALVILSTSKTSLLGLLLGFAVLGAYGFMQRGPVSSISLVWTGVAGAAGLVFSLILAPEVVVGLIGRDLTLTGRTDIWGALMAAIETRPWLGYGYGAFWEEDYGPAYWVRVDTEWDVPTAHNGIIEVWLSVGLIGVAIFTIDYLVALGRGVMQAIERPSGVFAVGFFLLFALFSISESVIMKQNSILWAMYVAFVGKLALDAAARSSVNRSAMGPVYRPHRRPGVTSA